MVRAVIDMDAIKYAASSAGETRTIQVVHLPSGRENTFKNRTEFTLEDGDIVNIPAKSDVIVVQGEVGLPGAFTYNKDYHIDDYIKSAGYLNERANKERILVIKANGKAEKFDASMFSFSSAPKIDSGDAILVLPKVEGKTLQITGALTQILYHVAIATKVVLDI